MKCSYDIWKEVERRRDEASKRYEELKATLVLIDKGESQCPRSLCDHEISKQLGRLEALDGLYRWLEVK